MVPASPLFISQHSGGDNILVMCDCYEPPKVNPDGTLAEPKAIPTNTRAACAEVSKAWQCQHDVLTCSTRHLGLHPHQ